MERQLAVVWNSMWGGKIGYSMHSEELAFALQRQGVHLMHRPVDHAFSGRPHTPGLHSALDHALDDDAFQISYAYADQIYLGHRGFKIGFTMLEVDGLPNSWVDVLNAVDEVFVPSDFNRETFSNSGVKTPIQVMPLGVDQTRFNPSLDGDPIPDVFMFLSVFEWGERKAPELLLQAFNREFKRKEDVVLFIKTMNHDPSVDIAHQVRALRLDSGGGRICFSVNERIPDDQRGRLYRSADCFVLPTRGEGWGMPILEAMACGLPVIATKWSGQTEFLTDEVAYLLRVRRLTPAVAKCPYYEGLNWAEPDTGHLQFLLRYVYEHQEEARARGLKASQQVLASFTWEKAAFRIRERLRQIP